MKKLSNIKVSLPKQKLRKLKSGAAITLKPEDLNESGENELQITNLKHKKLDRNHKKNKGFRLSLSEDETLDGEGVQAVGNVRQKIKVPSRKILDGGCGKCGSGIGTQKGVDEKESSYNTFVTSNHSAMNPLIGHNLDQSYHFRYLINRKGPEVMMGGGICGNEFKVGTPFNPRINQTLDQSHPLFK